MKTILDTLNHAEIAQLIVYGLIVNFAIYLSSLGLYYLLSRMPDKQQLGAQQRILRSDVILSFVTVICNTIVFILGVLLWKYGFITLADGQSVFRIVLEVIILIVIMDLLMYVFHRSVHFLRYFRKIHERHHMHESTNMLSLFVLHPVESIGFGLMMLAVIYIFPFSAIGISVYLLINSLWGTIGHLNYSVLPESLVKIAKGAYLCTSEFHYLHHQYPGFNFGFYTSIWDFVFKTQHPSLYKSK